MNRISLGKMDNRIAVTGFGRNASIEKNQSFQPSNDVSNADLNKEPESFACDNSGVEKTLVQNNSRQQPDSQAADIIEEANRRANLIIEQAREDANGILRGAFSEIWDEMGQPDTHNDSTTLNVNDVENKTRVLENNLRDTLQSYSENIQNTLQNYRESIQKMLYEFRVNLFATDFSQICDAYQRLYLFSTLMIDKRIKTIEDEELPEDTKTCIRQNLREIQGALNKRILRLENGLSAAGLTIIKPNEGEIYNSDEHMAANAEDDGTLEAIIKNCVYPGVRAGERVICRASVHLDLQ